MHDVDFISIYFIFSKSFSILDLTKLHDKSCNDSYPLSYPQLNKSGLQQRCAFM